MGMLALAGAVSGGGKALQQAASQTQSMMSQMQLLGIRDEMERARMKETFAHDEGMLSKRLAGESDLMREREGLQHTNTMARDTAQHQNTMERVETEQDFTAGQNRIAREEARQAEGRAEAREIDKEERAKLREVAKEVRAEGYKQDAEQREIDQRMKEWRRDRQAKKEDQQHDLAKEIVTETIRNQRPGSAGGASSTKLDGETNARLNVLSKEIDSEEKKLDNLALREEDRKKIQRRIDQLQAERRSLIGMSSTQPQRPPIRFPQ